MDLKTIIKDPMKSLDYMERLVNDGSKSGFTDIHTTSNETNPKYTESFVLTKIKVLPEDLRTYGIIPDRIATKDFLYLHPDWKKEDVSLGWEFYNSEIVIPTSSARTVKIQNTNMYLKLCYPKMIGRMDRTLGYLQLISGIELTEILNGVKKNSAIQDIFDFMPEIGGAIYNYDNREYGYLVRILPKEYKNSYIIPAFSLFSMDKLEGHATKKLIVQIIEKHKNKKDFLLKQIILPLVRIFFYLALNEGLIVEMHSQNTLYVFDKDWNVEKILIRDLESVDKDISIRHALKKNTSFLSKPIKSIYQDDVNYFKRHSLMYDHKLCEYLIDAILDASLEYIDKKEAQNEIKEYTYSLYGQRINSFFGNDKKWYKYPNTEIDRSTSERPFINQGESLYR